MYIGEQEIDLESASEDFNGFGCIARSKHDQVFPFEASDNKVPDGGIIFDE